jgi:hypothetical protein
LGWIHAFPACQRVLFFVRMDSRTGTGVDHSWICSRPITQDLTLTFAMDISKPSEQFKSVTFPGAGKRHLVRIRPDGTLAARTLCRSHKSSDRTGSTNRLTGEECQACRDAMHRQPRFSAQSPNPDDYEVHHQIDGKIVCGEKFYQLADHRLAQVTCSRCRAKSRAY